MDRQKNNLSFALMLRNIVSGAVVLRLIIITKIQSGQLRAIMAEGGGVILSNDLPRRVHIHLTYSMESVLFVLRHVNRNLNRTSARLRRRVNSNSYVTKTFKIAVNRSMQVTTRACGHWEDKGLSLRFF